MDSRTELRRVPVVVFDDGSLTRRSVERVARYAASVELVGGARTAGLGTLFESLNVPVIPGSAAGTDLASAVEAAAWSGSLLVAGSPLDPGPWLEALHGAAEAGGTRGLAVHVPAPGHTGTLAQAALTPQAVSWTVPLGAAFGTLAGLRPPAGMPAVVLRSGAVELLETQGADCLLLFAADAYPEAEPAQAAAPQPEYALTAADAILAVLTDTGLDITNRAPVTIAARIRFGLAGDAQTDIGAAEAELAPRRSVHVPHASLGFLDGLQPPAAVVRHWSHETETVYDGGTIRINGLDVRYLAEDGETIALRSYGTRQGLHVGVVALQLGEALGSSLTTAAGEYSRLAARRTAALSDVLGQLAASRGTAAGTVFPA